MRASSGVRVVIRQGEPNSCNSFICTGRTHKVHDGPPDDYRLRFGGNCILTDDEKCIMGGLVPKDSASEKKTNPSKPPDNIYSQLMESDNESVAHRLRRIMD